MQIELADPQGVERLHSLRKSGAALHDQPGITNSFGCQRELRRISRDRRTVMPGNSPCREVDDPRLARYRPRAWDGPQNLPRLVAVEQHPCLERPPVQVVLRIDARRKHLAERLVVW